MKNGEPTAHINTFGRNDLFTDETNTMGDELLLASREGFNCRKGAICNNGGNLVGCHRGAGHRCLKGEKGCGQIQSETEWELRGS